MPFDIDHEKRSEFRDEDEDLPASTRWLIFWVLVSVLLWVGAIVAVGAAVDLLLSKP